MAIDAVVTWVDGSDPAHRQRLAEYLAARGGAPPRAASATRFDDAGELEYCVASILRFAPWLRTLHIVTAGQTPTLLRRLAGTPWQERVRLVDHREIFAGFERFLPTFNSRAIISLLWRIPGLAERFVYFNDDFMLLRPVAEGDFFRDGRTVLRGRWRLQSRYSASQLAARLRARVRPGEVPAGHDPDASARDAQEASARLAGFGLRYFRLYHEPYPMRRNALEAFFAAQPRRLEENVRHRLRSAAQFKTESLDAHLALAGGQAIVDNRLKVVQLKADTDGPARLQAKMARADADPAVAFACVQSLDLAPEPLRAQVLRWLRGRIGGLDEVLEGAIA